MLQHDSTTPDRWSFHGVLRSLSPLQRPLLHSAGVLAFYTSLFCFFFSPILVSGRLLAPGDGAVFFLPAFYAKRTLWSPLIFSGFPVAAEPQINTFYPIAWFLSRLGAWNAFVLAAYVMAASFCYGYVFTLTRSVLASLIGGMVYSMSGFFMAHLGHTAMVHGAAWIPLLLWALERSRHARSRVWVTIASVAVAHCGLCAHPQMLVYGLGLSAAYVAVMGWNAPAGRCWYYGSSLAAVIAGLGLAAVQLVPTAELARISQRAELNFRDFVSGGLPPREVIQLLFPYVFGSGLPNLYQMPHFGTWSLTETTGYVGILPLMLAMIAAASSLSDLAAHSDPTRPPEASGVRAGSGPAEPTPTAGPSHARHPFTWFWVGVAVLTGLLALGAATPLAEVMYRVPGYNAFRLPGRHFVIMALAVAILAGIGVAALQAEASAGERLAKRAALVVVALVVGGGLAIVRSQSQIRAAAAAHGIADLRLWPWQNPAVGVPLAMAVLSAGMTVWYSRGVTSRWRSALLCFFVVVDLGSFGWFYEWRFSAPDHTILEAPAVLQPYKQQVLSSNARVFPFEGYLAKVQGAVPNLNRLWEIPSANGFSPLMLKRYALALPWQDAASLTADNQVLDLLATRYLLIERGTSYQEGFEWDGQADVVIEDGRSRFEERTIPDVWATQIGIVAALGNSIDVADGDPVGLLRVTTADGEVITRAIRAGYEVSEWAYDRADVRPVVRHRRAVIFDSSAVHDDEHGTFAGHRYVAVFDLNGSRRVRGIEIECTKSAPVSILVRQVSLRDERTGASYPLSAGFTDILRWRQVDNLNGVAVYENLRVMPRAWIVPAVVTLKPDEILATIQHSRMPDGTRFDPWRVALVEEPLELVSSGSGPQKEVAVVRLSDTRAEVRVRSAAEAFLVLSDVDYPGWQAAIDGRPTHLYTTNYLLRGVVIPPGDHEVEFTFRPSSLYLGVGISGLSLFGLFAAPFLSRRIPHPLLSSRAASPKSASLRDRAGAGLPQTRS